MRRQLALQPKVRLPSFISPSFCLVVFAESQFGNDYCVILCVMHNTDVLAWNKFKSFDLSLVIFFSMISVLMSR